MENITIVSQKENPLFNRKEVELNVEANVSPKISEAEEAVAKEFSVNQENVKIKKVNGKFGSNKFLITANIYSSKEDKEKTEPKPKEKKK